MRCYVKGRIKTGSDTIAIDYIEAKKDGKLFVLDWDETELGFDVDFDENGYRTFSGRLKGIKLNDEYANGKLNEIKGAELTNIQFYISDEDFVINDLRLDVVQLDDEGNLYDFDTDNSYTGHVVYY